MTKTDVAELRRRIAEMQAALTAARPYVAAAVLRAPAPYGRRQAADLAKVDEALK